VLPQDPNESCLGFWVEIHLGNLKDDCPIKPVKDQPSRYEDIILFLHENRTPKQFTLKGDEDYKEKAAVAKSDQNWKTKVLKCYFLVEAETEHSESQLLQMYSGEDPNNLAIKPLMH
jgi:hypothetical protein